KPQLEFRFKHYNTHAHIRCEFVFRDLTKDDLIITIHMPTYVVRAKGGKQMNNNYRTSYHFKNRIEIVEIKKDLNSPYPEDTIEVLFSKAWADIRTMKGREYNIAKLAGNEGKSRFIIRYMKGIKAHMKIKYK